MTSQPCETSPQHLQVSPGSIASTGLGVGDEILRVGDADTAYLSHSEAQNRIKAAGNLLQLHIAKGVRDSQSTASPQPQKYATRLNQQLTKMNLDNAPDTPSNYGGHSSPGGYNPYSPTATNYYDQYASPPSPPALSSPNIYSSPSQMAPPMAPPLPPVQQPLYRSAPTPPPVMPDAVLNMAAKGAPDKKPWAYAPDASMLKEHRDRVRRRKPSGPDITQSPVYKMIHGLDEPQQRPQRPAPEGYGQYPVRQPSADDELSFSGVRSDTYDHIPSRAFHKLQSLTGGSEIDRSSIRQAVSGVASKPSRRILRRAESAPGPRDDDDGVDISYVGANIPSRSFKMLQQSVGEPTDYDPTSRGPDVPHKRQGRKVKVVTLRSKQPAEPATQQPTVEDRATDF